MEFEAARGYDDLPAHAPGQSAQDESHSSVSHLTRSPVLSFLIVLRSDQQA